MFTRSILLVCNTSELVVSGPNVVVEPEVLITAFALVPSVNLAIFPAPPEFTCNGKPCGSVEPIKRSGDY